MENNCSNCCERQNSNSNLKKGVLFGLLPHSFCLAFIIFSILGVTAATAFFRQWLLLPYFFPLLVLLSGLLATVSAMIYLRQGGNLSWKGVKQNKRYLMVLYLTVIGVNLLLFLVVFPLTANLKSSGKTVLGQTGLSSKTLRVEIPCPGHAPLIVDELKKTEGVIEVKYRLPNLFEVSYSSDETSLEEILNLEIFKTFKARGV